LLDAVLPSPARCGFPFVDHDAPAAAGGRVVILTLSLILCIYNIIACQYPGYRYRSGVAVNIKYSVELNVVPNGWSDQALPEVCVRYGSIHQPNGRVCSKVVSRGICTLPEDTQLCSSFISAAAEFAPALSSGRKVRKLHI